MGFQVGRSAELGILLRKISNTCNVHKIFIWKPHNIVKRNNSFGHRSTAHLV